MADNKESFQESVLIRRAKRRLFGAAIILIALFVLSIFFLQDRTNINEKNSKKISFLEMNNEITVGSYRRKPQNFSQVEPKEIVKKFQGKESQKFVSDENPYFIQVGIFSDETNASRLLDTIKSLGYGARLEIIKMSGKEKLKLTTTAFNSKTEAQFALTILKSANLPGIIKRE